MDWCIICKVMFQCKLSCGTVNLVQVADACAGLRLVACMNIILKSHQADN